MKFRVVLPAFNEAENLKSLIPNVLSHLEDSGFQYEVCVVDDGSTDNTEALMNSFSTDYPIRLLTHSVNRGLGNALLTAFKTLAAECDDDDDVICTLDADNTHSPLLFGPLARKVSEGFDVVIASRFAPGGEVVGLSIFRQFLSRAAAMFLSTIYPVEGVTDYTSGFRAYRASAIVNGLDQFGDRLITRADFSCNAELLIKILSLGAKPAEIPLRLRYDRKHGRSKLQLFRTVFGYIVLLKNLGGLHKR